MGSVVDSVEGRHLLLSVLVAANSPLERVEVVRDLAVWKILLPTEDSPDALNAVLQPRGGGPAIFYLRVFQKNGERAWSSPIWLE